MSFGNKDAHVVCVGGIFHLLTFMKGSQGEIKAFTCTEAGRRSRDPDHRLLFLGVLLYFVCFDNEARGRRLVSTCWC